MSNDTELAKQRVLKVHPDAECRAGGCNIMTFCVWAGGVDISRATLRSSEAWIDAASKLPALSEDVITTETKCESCDLPIRETHMGRIRNEWEHLNGLSFCADGKHWAWPKVVADGPAEGIATKTDYSFMGGLPSVPVEPAAPVVLKSESAVCCHGKNSNCIKCIMHNENPCPKKVMAREDDYICVFDGGHHGVCVFQENPLFHPMSQPAPVVDTTFRLEMFDGEAKGKFREWYPSGFSSTEEECIRMAELYKSKGNRVRLVRSSISIVEL